MPTPPADWKAFSAQKPGSTAKMQRPTGSVVLQKMLLGEARSNVVSSRTVMTLKLKNRPFYFTISHTWGRWGKSGDGAKVIRVPWIVFENE